LGIEKTTNHLNPLRKRRGFANGDRSLKATKAFERKGKGDARSVLKRGKD